MIVLRINGGAIEFIDFREGSDELYKLILQEGKKQEPLGHGRCLYHSDDKAFFHENLSGDHIVRFYGDCIIATEKAVENSRLVYELKNKILGLREMLIDKKIVKPEAFRETDRLGWDDPSSLVWQIKNALWNTYPEEIKVKEREDA